ncbi:ATP-binding protein [Ureaplasma sp. ES3154-GEN]|uniref:ATP-binding protein n=1 Tax=Ureaplasma sp. ES3154-GEN TaxID=2984844 RepID=UPI0021E7268F|nr:ATP-binding protein [Ureaplasma sp. ES3154-GEN]MCV3743409.1 ATP-binding protein [Ureaplasma sp. ES3154-GEN]
MINNIVFINKKTSETYQLDFSPNLNIILGKKGSGKSSLLLIIALAIARQNVKSPDLTSFYNYLGWEVKSISYDGQVFDNSSHREINYKSNEKELIYNDLQKVIPGYITQDDKRKISLDSTDLVQKEKKNVIKKLVDKINRNNPLDNVFKVFKELQDAISEYQSLENESVNFTSFFQTKKSLKDLQSNTTNFYDEIKYDSRDIVKKIDNDIKMLEDKYTNALKNFQNDFDSFQTFVDKLNTLENQTYKLVDESTIISLKENQHAIDELLRNQCSLLEKTTERLTKHKKIYRIFENTLKEKKGEINQQRSLERQIFDDFKDVKNYFTKTISILNNIRAKYKEIIDKPINIDWDFSEYYKTNHNLTFRLKPFVIDTDSEGDILKNNIIKKCICDTKHNYLDLNKIKIDESKWKGVIKELIEDKVELYAGDKRYKDMSNGEKTLFGVLYAIKSVTYDVQNHNYLLLDQIEDNLDSQTVLNDLLPEIKKQSENNKQIFLITHNANLGILLEGKVISTDIHAENISDKFKNNDEVINGENAQSTYLEGSYETLKKRNMILSQKTKRN